MSLHVEKAIARIGAKVLYQLSCHCFSLLGILLLLLLPAQSRETTGTIANLDIVSAYSHLISYTIHLVSSRPISSSRQPKP